MLTKRFIAVCLSIIVALLYVASFYIARKFGVNDKELLSSLTASIPSALSVIVAIIVAIFSKTRQIIDWHVITIPSDWKLRIRIRIVNLCAHPLYDFTLEGLSSSVRMIRLPPENLEPLKDAVFIAEIGPNSQPATLVEQYRHVAPKTINLIVRYRDSARSKSRKKIIRARNPHHIPFANLRFITRRIKDEFNRL